MTLFGAQMVPLLTHGSPLKSASGVWTVSSPAVRELQSLSTEFPRGREAGRQADRTGVGTVEWVHADPESMSGSAHFWHYPEPLKASV